MPGGSFNWSGAGIKEGKNQNPVQATLYLKSEFDKENNIETKDDTGYVGGASTKLGEIRVKADGTITLKDNLRWGEGLEHFLFGMFGGNRVGVPGENDEAGLYIYNFGNGQDLPFFTFIQGLNMSDEDDLGTLKPTIFDNAIINQLKLTLANDGNINIEIGCLNDYPLYNIVPTDPTRVYRPVSFIVSKANVKIGIGDVGADDTELVMTDCIQSLDADFNWNAASKSCYADQFGKNNLARGELGSSVKYVMDLNKNNMRLEEKHATGVAGGTYVNEKPYEQKVVIFISGYLVNGSRTSCRIEIPTISLKPPKRGTSGTEGVNIEVDANTIMELATGQIVDIRIASELAELLISNQTYTLP